MSTLQEHVNTRAAAGAASGNAGGRSGRFDLAAEVTGRIVRELEALGPEAQWRCPWHKAGAQRFYWKYCSTFDSTPRGNIGPVAEALMKTLGTSQTIYCPAFPENGRSIFMGNLFVGEQPLAESPMKDHPLTPMRDSNLLRLLEPQVALPVGLANRHAVGKGPDSLRDRLAELQADNRAIG